MTDRPTNPTDRADRPTLRPAAYGNASAAQSVGIQSPTDSTDQTTNRPTGSTAGTNPTAATDPTNPTDPTDPTPDHAPTRPARRLFGFGRKQPTDPTTPTADHKPEAPKPTPVAPRPAPPRPTNPKPTTNTNKPTDRPRRRGQRLLIGSIAALLAFVVAAPIALSAQDLVEWAESSSGLNLDFGWATLVFMALDAAAAVCVLLSVYCAWRGEPAGGFGIAVWVFALVSAFANYQHGTREGAPGDAWWFFPLMSILGPALLEMVTRKLREWVQRGDNRRGKRMPHFGWRRWVPGVGSWTDTYGAYRTANLLGIETVDLAVAWYHYLCPDGSLKVAKAMRAKGVHASRVNADRPPTDPTASVEATDSTAAPTVAPTAPPRPVAPTVQASTSLPTVPAPTRPTVPVQPTKTSRIEASPAPTAPRPSPTRNTDQSGHSAAAVANAKYLRSHYPTGLPKMATIRADLKWSFDRANNAVAAYNDGADQTDSTDLPAAATAAA